jgi:glycosyltransferase involved in cell wall biosynthesis
VASIEVVIPVLNEERALPGCIGALRTFLKEHMSQHTCRITVADNGSTDTTLVVAEALSREHPGEVNVIHLNQRGRGRALRRAWLESDADVVSYMDVDLSTELEAFPALVDAIVVDGCHVATGSRLSKGSQTTRSPKREVVSRAYNLIIRAMHWTSLADTQCGFKALSREAAQLLVPLVVNNHWFFDTELLLIAKKRRFRIREIPVTWREDPDTRVKVVKTALEDLRGLARLRLGGIPRVKPP